MKSSSTSESFDPTTIFCKIHKKKLQSVDTSEDQASNRLLCWQCIQGRNNEKFPPIETVLSVKGIEGEERVLEKEVLEIGGEFYGNRRAEIEQIFDEVIDQVKEMKQAYIKGFRQVFDSLKIFSFKRIVNDLRSSLDLMASTSSLDEGDDLNSYINQFNRLKVERESLNMKKKRLASYVSDLKVEVSRLKEMIKDFQSHWQTLGTQFVEKTKGDIKYETKYIVSASSDGSIQMIDINTKSAFHKFESVHTGPIYSLACSLDGKHLISGSNDGCIKVIDIPMKKISYSFDNIHKGKLLSEKLLRPDCF